VKFKPQQLAAAAAAFWIIVGTRLIVMGLMSLSELAEFHDLIIIVPLVVLIAYLKGIHIFGLLAKNNMVRLNTLEKPIPFYRFFSIKTYALIALFMPVGILLGKNLHRPFYRAIILLSVGFALFIGGLQYIRHWKAVFKS